jgi:hypothetical protein
MAYALDLALDQWNQGELRVGRSPEMQDAIDAVIGALRKRLGAFEITELADLYGEGVDWALNVAQERASGTEVSYAVDAAFARYARQASDYAGGRTYRPDDDLPIS